MWLRAAWRRLRVGGVGLAVVVGGWNGEGWWAGREGHARLRQLGGLSEQRSVRRAPTPPSTFVPQATRTATLRQPPPWRAPAVRAPAQPAAAAAAAGAACTCSGRRPRSWCSLGAGTATRRTRRRCLRSSCCCRCAAGESVAFAVALSSSWTAVSSAGPDHPPLLPHMRAPCATA